MFSFSDSDIWVHVTIQYKLQIGLLSKLCFILQDGLYWSPHSFSAGAMAFDVEYARWLEEQNRQINELRSAVNSHASDTELRIIIDGILAHYDEIFRLKGIAAKADVFHLLSGMWKTPAERCFLWLGGFRSSELLKVMACFIKVSRIFMLGIVFVRCDTMILCCT